MRELPLPDPGPADHRSPLRYLLWVARRLLPSLCAGMGCGIVWMVTQALMPATIGQAIDSGLTGRDVGALAMWSGALLALGVGTAVAGLMRHRFVVFNWLAGAYLTIQVVTRQATRLGATLPKRLATGEVVSVGIADISHVGNALDVTARAAGAVVSIAVIGVILLLASPVLGLLVLLGVPLMAAAVAPLLRPLHRAQQHQRELVGRLTTRSGDIVAGLRVLRGIGGEQVFADRYRAESQAVRWAGVRVARADALLDAAQVLLPGLLVALVTWLGARFAMDGKISVGQLVAFYGYAFFLIQPMRTLTEAADKVTKALVSAGRVVRILAMRPELSDEGTAAAPGRADLVDIASGLVVRPGRLLAVAAADPADALAIADRLSRFADGEVAWGAVRLRDVPMETVRRRILVATNDDRLFSGRLGEELTAGADVADADRLRTALHAACAEDLVDDVGLDSQIAGGGREFSGGQQQRLRLARALATDPDVLILVEPTSAVDAHTEARIAARLGKARGGRTTIVCTTSPLVLDRADHIAYVENGSVIAEGTHRDLLATEPRYAATVTREESE
ncbi:MAG TPA: ABC transporter ATP-binding protein [Streptosporangiaceae bacterium]|nr:ABC transporter ATP-binding protein [Streptosporangiaceae bacterium]